MVDKDILTYYFKREDKKAENQGKDEVFAEIERIIKENERYGLEHKKQTKE